MEKIQIITDSASDISSKLRSNLTVIPIQVCFGEEVYFDGVSISNQEFYKKLADCDELPATSMISPAIYQEEFKKAVDENKKVIVITLSSKLSGTYNSAVMAAADFDDKVAVVDSLNATVGQQILVEYALNLADKGMAFDEIVSMLEIAKKHIRLLGLVQTLKYLKKGGRISKTVAFFGEALNIKPVLTIRDGVIEMLAKSRGIKNGISVMASEIEKAGGINHGKPFCIGYTGENDSIIKQFITQTQGQLWNKRKHSIPTSPIGATIGTHVGPDSVIIAFFDNKI